MKNKYEVLGIVGEGAYGIVYKCKNKENNKFVAVKKFKETEDKLVQKTMKRELSMLQLVHHENVVEFQEAFVSKGNFFLLFEYVEKNLLELLEESPKGLSTKLIRSLIYQMCKAVSYLHKNNMIHRDVKPENLLIDENLNLKLCDFGFARKINLNNNNDNVDNMTDYVATRWYRSPELLLTGGMYGPAVDYWAIGCIMGELADGNPMFPGDNEVDQLDCILKILGNLPEGLIKMYYNNPIYNEKQLIDVKNPETLEKRYLGILSPTAIDFMKGLLELDPNKRLNDETVFKHKYFSIFMNNNNNSNNEGKNPNINNNSLIKSNSNKNSNIKETKYNMNNIVIVNKEENIIKRNDKNNNLEMNNNHNNTNNTINNTNTKAIAKNILNPKIKKEPELKSNNTMPAKVINNTTNINIINYNCYSNSPNRNNIPLPKKINQTQKAQIRNLINQEVIENNLIKTKEINANNLSLLGSHESFYANKSNNIVQKKLNNFNKSMISFNSFNLINKLNLGNKNTSLKNFSKKSSSMNKIEDHSNFTISQKVPTLNIISLSQGKIDQNNYYKSLPKPGNTTFYNLNSKMINQKNNINNNKNINSNMPIINNAYSTNGFKSFYNNKDNKYNYKINTKYIKEESKKYLYNSSFNDKIIDEKEEFDGNSSIINDYKKKNNSIEKNNKKSTGIIDSDKYKIYNQIQKKNNGYGTFYNFNKNNFLFGNNKKVTTNKVANNNNNKLPKLFKSISNITQYNFGFGNKNKMKKNTFYYKGKQGYNQNVYDYSDKFKYYLP